MAIYTDVYFVSYSVYYDDSLVYIGNMILEFPEHQNKTTFLEDATKDIVADRDFEEKLDEYKNLSGEDYIYTDQIKIIFNSVAKL